MHVCRTEMIPIRRVGARFARSRAARNALLIPAFWLTRLRTELWPYGQFRSRLLPLLTPEDAPSGLAARAVPRNIIPCLKT
jgi:hypothetical protein